MSHKKFGPDRFSRFDVYWIQTDRQSNKQTDRQAKFIYRSLRLYWLQDTSEKAWKRRNQGQHTTMVWILSTRQGEKVDINGSFSDFFQILEMCLVQGSKIVYCLLAMWMIFFQSNTLFSVAFANDTNVASKSKRLNTPADTINKESENNLLVHV